MTLPSKALERLEGSRLDALGLTAPFTIPSGIVTTTPSSIELMAKLAPEIGFITTKTISVAPRSGYREPIIYEYSAGCFANAVGLTNPGARNFLDEMRKHMPLADNKPLFVSIMGTEPKDFLECALMLETVADAFEINLSCPHVKGAGQTVGSDPEMVSDIVTLLRQRTQRPIIPKLSPNLPNVASMAKICVDNGADGICLINTVGPGIVTDDHGNPALTNVNGGLSGAGILPIGLKAVKQTAAVVDAPIIACGGISEPGHVRAYYEAGASLFGVGSALAGMTTIEILEFFKTLNKDLQVDFTNRPKSKKVRKSGLTNYTVTRISEKRSFGEGLTEIKLEDGPGCEPGQFFFLRIPGVGEKPFSPGMDKPPLYLVRKVGPFTEALDDLSPGDQIYLRGPYGNGFPEPEPERPLVLVGGGTGIAPLMMAAGKWKDRIFRSYAGFSGQVDRWFRYDLAGRIPYCKVIIDPPGQPGEIIKVIEEDIAKSPGDYYKGQFFICGPVVMANKVVELINEQVNNPIIYVAREDVMRCGIGLCGSCATEDGRRSCVDGPVISPHEIFPAIDYESPLKGEENGSN